MTHPFLFLNCQSKFSKFPPSIPFQLTSMATEVHPFLSLLLFSLLLSISSNKTQTSSQSATSPMQTQELSALYEVISSLIEDESFAQLHPRPCSDTPWPGIQCELIQNQITNIQDPFLHVTKLHIGPDILNPPCKSNPTLSSSILNLPFLKTLSLFNCFQTPLKYSLSPSLFTNQSSLEQLVLNSNSGLFGKIPETISQVKNLRVVSLSENNFSGEIPRGISGLKKLKQLDLSYNHFTGEIPEEIGGLTSLTILDLSWNKLQGKIPKSIGEINSLQKIDVSFNSLSNSIPEEFGNLRRLILLDLSNNSITGPIPGRFSNLQELEYFLIENNQINTPIPEFIGELRKLSVVGFSGCGLTGPIPTSLGLLKNLSALQLDRNKLNGSVPANLSTLQRLGQLNLSQNELTGEVNFGEEFVARLGNRLDIRDNTGLCLNSSRVNKVISDNDGKESNNVQVNDGFLLLLCSSNVFFILALLWL